MEEDINKLKSIFSLGISAVASEHFFSTFLSSPLTIKTLYKDKPDLVREYLIEASLISIVFGALMDYLLKDTNHFGLIGTSAVCLIYWAVYEDALK